MTPAEHYAEAEKFLRLAEQTETGDPLERYQLAAAQVHATLATVLPRVAAEASR
jgi:hypothetical protein